MPIAETLIDATALAAVRRDIHAHPELGCEEHRTSDLIARLLSESGHRFPPSLWEDRNTPTRRIELPTPCVCSAMHSTVASRPSATLAAVTTVCGAPVFLRGENPVSDRRPWRHEIDE